MNTQNFNIAIAPDKITKVVIAKQPSSPPAVELSLTRAQRLSDQMVVKAFRLAQNSWFVLSFLLLTVAALCTLRGYGVRDSNAQITFGLAAAIWTFLLARTRLRLNLACLACLYVLLLTIAPFYVGDHFTRLTATTMYDRAGYALIFLVLLEALSAPSSASSSIAGKRDLEIGGGMSTGAALAILLFTKSGFFMAGVLVLIAVVSLRKQRMSRWASIAATFSAVFLCTLAYFRFDLTHFLDEFRAAQISPVRILFAALDVVSVEGMAFMLFVLISAVVLWKGNEANLAVQIGLAGAAVLFTGAFLLLVSNHDHGLPLNTVLELLIAEKLLGHFKASACGDRAILRCLIAGAVLLTAGAMTGELASISYAAFNGQLSAS